MNFARACSQILEDYAGKTPGSAKLAQRADSVFPAGITHAGRYLRPHPIFIRRAEGSRKWDVDGNEYIDYFGGHGALILGHNHPEVIEAVQGAMADGVHFGASHELELVWAELIRDMVPSAERVRFTVTGTETTLLAMRVARAYTGKSKIVRLAGHFHGWHDQVVTTDAGAPGVPDGAAETVLLIPPGDLESLRNLVTSRDDLAALMLEPTGASFGLVPLPDGYLAEARRITEEAGILLIFDEVITGFRCSPGGAQAHYGITPDLTALAKVIAGGFPGAALVGRAEILDTVGQRQEEGKIKAAPVLHQGTYNSGPVTAAAGIATLRLIRETDVIPQANKAAKDLRKGMEEAVQQAGLPWVIYGEFSGFHIFPNPQNAPITREDIYAAKVPWQKLKGATPQETIHQIRAGLLLNGIDIMSWPGGTVSAVHTEVDIEKSIDAFQKLLAMTL